jgi:ribosomal protein S18 acetylase RimI-like enzyme
MTLQTSIHYRAEPELSVLEFRRVLNESGLGATRPVDDSKRLHEMLSNANLILTARLDGAEGPVVGVARCITDFSWCCYLSELAVSPMAQGLGVGRGLIDAIRHEIGPMVSLNLASMPDAVGFYEKIGMPRQPDTFCFRRRV